MDDLQSSWNFLTGEIHWCREYIVLFEQTQSDVPISYLSHQSNSETSIPFAN